MARTLIAIGLFVALTYGISVYATDSGKGSGLKPLLPRMNDDRRKPGDEFRTGLTGDMVSPDPTDAEEFLAKLSAKERAGVKSGILALVSGPATTGNDPAYGTINGGAQILNKGMSTQDREGVIAYDLATLLA